MEVLFEKNVQTFIDNGKTTYKVREISPSKKLWYSFIKRSFDLVVCLLALIVVAIPMLLLMVMIRLDSPGPAIYKQERLGKGGKPFTLYKLRSMHVDAEKNGAQWAQDNDSRCTKFGKILRKCRLDELPQLLNIIKGDMSIVGPRPERACFYEQFAEYIEGFDQRLCVKPGLTGYAQVSGGYDLKPEEKIVYDLEYIEKRSVLMDVSVICKTVLVVFNHKGAR